MAESIKVTSDEGRTDYRVRSDGSVERRDTYNIILPDRYTTVGNAKSTELQIAIAKADAGGNNQKVKAE